MPDKTGDLRQTSLACFAIVTDVRQKKRFRAGAIVGRRLIEPVRPTHAMDLLSVAKLAGQAQSHRPLCMSPKTVRSLERNWRAHNRLCQHA